MNVAAQPKSENGPRSIEGLLEALAGLSGIQRDSLGCFEFSDRKYSLLRFTLRGPNSNDPIRIGVFAALHGDEPGRPGGR